MVDSSVEEQVEYGEPIQRVGAKIRYMREGNMFRVVIIGDADQMLDFMKTRQEDPLFAFLSEWVRGRKASAAL